MMPESDDRIILAHGGGGELTRRLLAERIFYLPAVGFSIAAGWILWIVFQERRRVGMALIAVWIGFLSVRTVTRVPVWRTHFDLFIDLTEHFPQSGRAHWFLGSIYAGQGNRNGGRDPWADFVLVGDGSVTLTSASYRLLGPREKRFLTIPVTLGLILLLISTVRARRKT